MQDLIMTIYVAFLLLVRLFLILIVSATIFLIVDKYRKKRRERIIAEAKSRQITYRGKV